MSKLNLDIHNFGPINQANIELKNLNVIAGINGSGKTTASKLLYCLLTSNTTEGDYLANNSIYNRFIKLINNFNFKSYTENFSEFEKTYNNSLELNNENFNENLKENMDLLKKIIRTNEIQNKNEFIEHMKNMENIIEINSNERRKFFNVSNTLLKSEFNINDLKINKNTKVSFYTEEDDLKFSFKLGHDDTKLGFELSEGNLNYLKNKNVIYLDSSSIYDIRTLDKIIYLKNPPHHLRFLSNKLNLTKDNNDVYDSLFNQKLDECLNKINSLIGGYIYYDVEEKEFLFKKDDNTYHMKNTASGVKQIGILQILLSNRLLNENSFLIIDEPEVNLHPEWQVKFAKLIILLIKELNITVFINSHSPQFIEALEVYSAKYGLKNKTNYYLSQKDESNDKYNIKQISQENLHELYNNLGDPYDILDEIRGENIANHL